MRDYYNTKRNYVGQLKVDGKRTWEHGIGYYDVSLTGKAVGDFHMNKVEGYSAKEWYHGEKYIGQVHQNKKDGYGVHIWPSGARFYGQFKGNQPAGYGVLETVHEGIKFIGRVNGFVAEDIGPGQWYLNNQPVDVENLICNDEGIVELEPNTKWLNPVGDVIEKLEDGTVRTTEKNLTTELKEQGPYQFQYGHRDTTMYGDWIRTFRGHFISGRYHGYGVEQRLGGENYASNYICGDPVTFETYSNLAFSTLNETRSVKRRMSRRYCAIYDMVMRHVNSFKPKDLVIMEFGIGKGEHLQFLRKLFPEATIVGVDKLTLDHIPDTELEQQQLDDLRIASKIKDVNLELGYDAYSKDAIYHLVNTYGKIGIGIHDATHGAQAWNQLDTIIECMNPQHGVVITEEMCCKDGEPNLRELKKAIGDGWRVFDFNPLTHGRYTDSLIGIRCFEHIDTDALSSYEIN